MSKLSNTTSENRVSTLGDQMEAARAHRAYTVSYSFKKLQVHLQDALFQSPTVTSNDQYDGKSTNTLGANFVQKLETASTQPIVYSDNPETTHTTINPDHFNNYESSQTPVQPLVPEQSTELTDQAQAIADARAALDEIHQNPLFNVNKGE